MPAQDKKSKQNKKQNKKPAAVNDEESDAEELCFICTEPITTFAVADCDHRTCHKCALRLRALYETRSCAYCKAEETAVIFTKEIEKPFAEYTESDTPYADKKLNIKFETQDMYKDAMNMMKYNCSQKDCTVCCKDWGDLKLHIRKEHNLNLCDLCIKHKKVFPFEHTLYTSAQLMEHHQKGDKGFIEDDETGFSGHPECQFCKTRFFGNDELYVHCRDNHEQCFLCVREGIRHEYYINYGSLEEHFKKDHYMCLYPQCLEKKFVVFGSSIDLIGHEAEVHGESTSGLQRCMQTEARRVELNFQYDSFRPSRMTDGRKNNRNSDKTNKSNSNSSGNGSTTSLSANDFPSIQKAAASSSSAADSSNQSRLIPGAPSRKKGKQKAVQKPSGFGGLSGQESTSSSGTATPDTAQEEPSVVTSHAVFLIKLESMLQSKQKVTEFRRLTGAFRKGTMGADAYVSQVVQLAGDNVEKSNKIFKGVENLLDLEDKKLELVRAWRNKHTAMTQFPALEVKSRTPSNSTKTSRVLVIKNTKPAKASKVTKTPWDKPTVPSPSSSGSESSVSRIQRASPSATHSIPRKANNNNNNSDFPSLESKAFPSLPTAAPKHKEVLNMRRNTSQPRLNAWGSSSDQQEGQDIIEEETDLLSTDKKKKGRKNKVLLRVGL